MKIGEIGDSCGMLFLTGFIPSQILLRYIAFSWSERKFAVYFTSSREMWCFFHLIEKMFIVDKAEITFDIKG